MTFDSPASFALAKTLVVRRTTINAANERKSVNFSIANDREWLNEKIILALVRFAMPSKMNTTAKLEAVFRSSVQTFMDFFAPF